MRNRLIILLLFLSVLVFGQSVPNTDTFHLSDVASVVGGTSLTQCFTNSVDSYFDPTYKGSKDRLSNFRNYTVPLTALYPYWNITSDSANASPTFTTGDDDLHVVFRKAVDTATVYYTLYYKRSDLSVYSEHGPLTDTTDYIGALAIGYTYNVYIRAFDSYNYRNSNVYTTLTITDVTAPVLSSSFSVSQQSSTQGGLDITWGAATDGSGSVTYQVDESTDGSTWTTIYNGTSTTTFYIGTDGVTYYFRMRAVDPSGNYSSYSSSISITVHITP